MGDERDKWADLFDDGESTGDSPHPGGRPPGGDDYVDPGAPLGDGGEEFHDPTPPLPEETGELTDEFTELEHKFLDELGIEESHLVDPVDEGSDLDPFDEGSDPEPVFEDSAASPSAEDSAVGPVAAGGPPDSPEDGEPGEPPATPPAEEAPLEEPPAEEPLPAEESPPAEELPLAEEPSAEEPPPAEEPPLVEEPLREEPPAEEPAQEIVAPQPTEEAEPVLPIPPSPPPPPPPPAEPTFAQRSLAGAVEALTKEQIDERRPAPLWSRFLAGALVVVISMATATAVSAIAFLAEFAEGLTDDSGVLKGVQQRLDAVDGGEPQTMLILGSDIRPGDIAGRSDTTMLLRLDGDRDAISLFSLPRDLKVNIPGIGIDKLNAAYSYGGPKKTLEVVQQITGLEVNHLVNVDFTGFAKAVDAIDCVYVDVDRDYYHSNVGVAFSEQYAEIDVSAGYQRLCGLRALQYVRYRHTDNDIVRSARQQDFLREARQKVSPAKIWTDRDELIDIFDKYTTSDIDDIPTIIELIKLFIDARSAPVNQIHFEGGFEESYVTASNAQMKRAVSEFLGETSEPSEPSGSPSGGRKDGRKPKKKPKPAATPMIDSGPETLAFVELMARRKRMPAYLPTQIAPGSFFDDESRGYQIRLPSDKFADAYKLVFQISGVFGVPEYYGVMATEWTDPPILENPSEIRTIGEREFMLFYDSDRLRLVGFKTDEGAYWVSNTLLQSLSEPQMLAVATSMREVKA